MSTYYDNASDIIASANGIQNGVDLIDGIVPDFTVFPQNGIVPVDSADIPENVNGGKYDPFTEIEILSLRNSDGFLSNSRNVRVKRESG